MSHPRKAKERLDARARRRAIPPETRAAKSLRIRRSAIVLPEVARALAEGRAVGCYVSVRSEVDTRGLLQQLLLLAAPGSIAVPRMRGDAMELTPLGALEDLGPGAHGIPELPAAAPALVAPPAVLFVPGLLFTEDGHRLGNGGGHFDRLLAAAPEALRVGLAFEEQVVPVLPLEPHDEPLDLLVTEDRVRRFARAGRPVGP